MEALLAGLAQKTGAGGVEKTAQDESVDDIARTLMQQIRCADANSTQYIGRSATVKREGQSYSRWGVCVDMARRREQGTSRLSSSSNSGPPTGAGTATFLRRTLRWVNLCSRSPSGRRRLPERVEGLRVRSKS